MGKIKCAFVLFALVVAGSANCEEFKPTAEMCNRQCNYNIELRSLKAKNSFDAQVAALERAIAAVPKSGVGPLGRYHTDDDLARIAELKNTLKQITAAQPGVLKAILNSLEACKTECITTKTLKECRETCRLVWMGQYEDTDRLSYIDYQALVDRINAGDTSVSQEDYDKVAEKIEAGYQKACEGGNKCWNDCDAAYRELVGWPAHLPQFCPTILTDTIAVPPFRLHPYAPANAHVIPIVREGPEINWGPTPENDPLKESNTTWPSKDSGMPDREETPYSKPE